MRNEKKNVFAEGGDKHITEGELSVPVKTLEPHRPGLHVSSATSSSGGPLAQLHSPRAATVSNCQMGLVTAGRWERIKAPSQGGGEPCPARTRASAPSGIRGTGPCLHPSVSAHSDPAGQAAPDTNTGNRPHTASRPGGAGTITPILQAGTRRLWELVFQSTRHVAGGPDSANSTPLPASNCPLCSAPGLTTCAPGCALATPVSDSAVSRVSGGVRPGGRGVTRADRRDKGGADGTRTEKGAQKLLWPEADRGAPIKAPGSGGPLWGDIPGRGHSGREGPHLRQGLGCDGNLVTRGQRSMLRGGQGFSTSSPMPV